MLIDCNDCVMRGTNHCQDCVVSVLLDPTPREGAIVIDVEEERALREMARGGLIPEIRMKRRTSGG